MADLKVVYRSIESILPYEKNPRNNDEAVAAVKESIQEFGFKIPVVLSADGVIVAGHTRIKAAKELGMTKVPCIIADDLSEEQVRAFRLADNKSAEIATWDDVLLREELDNIFNINMELFGFLDEELPNPVDEENKYTMETKIPQYQITGECPVISEMIDTEKSDELIAEILEADGITDEEKQFLIEAARRHTIFNYRNIAEYYAHANPEMQSLMERSALVIIDFDNAISNGYASLHAEMLDIMEGEDDA